jgi:hypothetical protein
MSGFAPPKPEQTDSQAHRHQLELAGYNALLAEHCELVDRVAAIEQMLERLGLTQMAVDEMLLIGRRSRHEIVADLGNGWQIVRTPADPQSAHQ